MQKLFSCLWEGRTAIFKKIKTSDGRICTGESDVTYQQLEEWFGTPIDIVKSYYDSLEDEDRLIDRACFSRTLKKVMIIILMVISIIGVYDSAIMYFSYLDGKDSKVIYEGSTIYYDNTDVDK